MAKKVLRITSARPGFIRGGHPHPAMPTDYALDFFNKKQLEAIRAEPQLTVEEVDADQAAVVITGDSAAPVAPLTSLALDIPIGPEARVSLAAIIGIALVEGTLSNEAWNALSDAERGERLQPVLERFVAEERARLDRVEKPEVEVKPDGETATATNAETKPETRAERTAREKAERQAKNGSPKE